MGSVDIDMNCPLEIAREFLRRRLWNELNEQMGAAYDFTRQGEAVPEQEEPSTAMRDVAPQRLDSITRELEHVLVIRASTSKEKTLLDPQVPVTSYAVFLHSKSRMLHRSST